MANPFTRLFRPEPEQQARHEFMDAAWKVRPAMFDTALNSPDRPERDFQASLRGVEEALGGRGGDPTTAVEVLRHLLRVWPGGIVDYNAWYAVGTAQRMGMLDEKLQPVHGARPVDEHTRRMQELSDLGGPGAVAAYRSIMGDE